jgi:transcriptional regulator with XRE-family HTH domain
MRHNPEFASLILLETAQRLGERIRRARKARKISLTQIEKTCRIHRTTLSRLERGEPGVSLGVLLTVLEYFNELADLELLLSQPDVPKHQRFAPAPVLDRDF